MPSTTTIAGRPLSKIKKKMAPHFWVLSRDPAGGYLVTIGDPKKSSSKIKESFHGSDAKDELVLWAKYNIGKEVSEDHVIDQTGLGLAPAEYTQWYVENMMTASVTATLDDVAEALEQRGKRALATQVDDVSSEMSDFAQAAASLDRESIVHLSSYVAQFVFGDSRLRKDVLDDLRHLAENMPYAEMEQGGQFHKEAGALHKAIFAAIQKAVADVPFAEASASAQTTIAGEQAVAYTGDAFEVAKILNRISSDLGEAIYTFQDTREGIPSYITSLAGSGEAKKAKAHMVAIRKAIKALREAANQIDVLAAYLPRDIQILIDAD